MISRKPTYADNISFERGMRGSPAAGQRIRNREAGARKFYDSRECPRIKKERPYDWQTVTNQAAQPPTKGRGVAIYVEMLAMLLDPEPLDGRSMQSQLGMAMAEIVETHSVVVETHTGLRSDNREDRQIMIEYATQSIKLKRPNRVPNAKRGPKFTEFSDDDWLKAKTIWFDLDRYPTDKAAAEHLPEGMTEYIVRYRLKSSGRPTGRPRLRTLKRKRKL